MRRLLPILITLLLAGCATQRYVPTASTVQRDSIYVSSARLDSLYRSLFKRDSVYIHDSVYVYQKGDTVTKYVEKLKYVYRATADTVYRDRVIRDTAYIAKTDSVQVVYTEYVEKPIKWYNQGFIWLGRLCCIALILWILFLYLKRKL